MAESWIEKMADYCGGEYCHPYILYSTCVYCGQEIERYPNRPTKPEFEWRHVKGSEEFCSDWQGVRTKANPRVAV